MAWSVLSESSTSISRVGSCNYPYVRAQTIHVRERELQADCSSMFTQRDWCQQSFKQESESITRQCLTKRATSSRKANDVKHISKCKYRDGALKHKIQRTVSLFQRFLAQANSIFGMTAHKQYVSTV